jgi:ADP-ribose pyrophosphatase YjhB (NUDIX family)
MGAQPFQRQLASFLQRQPWLLEIARRTWRLRQTHFTVGAVGVVFNPQHEILLVEHVFHPYFPWGLPGGWVEGREDPSLTVKRELHEELELDVTVGPLLHLSTEYPNHLDLAYLCTASGAVGKLSLELMDYRWVPQNDLPPLHRFQVTAIEQALELQAQAR